MNFLAELLALALAFAGPTPRQETPEVIRLKVGAEVVGIVTEFDEARGVRIQRVDDDALLDVTFDQMLPEDARRLRAAKGYLPDEPEPLVVQASRIRMMNGEEFTGLIVEQGLDGFKFRQGSKVWDLKRERVREITPVQVDALEVYDPEELYAQELARRSPTAALDHYNMSLYCESLQLWAQAKEHLTRVKELEPAFKADIVAGKVKRAEMRMESSEDSEKLAKAQRFAQREQYDAALVLIADFLEKKPNSALKVEFEKTSRSIERQRAKWIRGQVIFNFFIFIDRTARSIATDSATSCKEARKKIELEGTKMALEATAAALKVKVEEVRSLWEDPKRQTASPHYASYGSGTWTLGDMELVTKGLVKDDGKQKADAEKADAADGQDSLEDKIKKLLEKKKKEQEEAAKKAAQGGAKEKKKAKAEIADIPPTDDDWWAQTPADEKTDYLLAWWADHDANVKVTPKGMPCAVCTGTGVIKFIDRSGDDKWVPCPRCKGAQIDRILHYQ